MSKVRRFCSPALDPRTLLALAAAAIAGCSGFSAPVVEPAPVVAVVAPAGDLEVAQGEDVEIRYVDDIAPGEGSTNLYADADGDLTTIQDQVAIEIGRDGADGAEQTVTWATRTAPAAAYRIIAQATRGLRTTMAVTAASVFVNAAPELDVSAPARDIAVARGGRIEIVYADSDPDDIAVTTVFLDGDGDFDTGGDQVPISLLRAEQDGAEQHMTWIVGDITPGLYSVVAVTWDGTNEPAVALAPGRVRVRAPSYSTITGPGDEDQEVEIVTFADGSFVVAGQFEATITLAGGTPQQTALSADGIDTFLARYDALGRLVFARRITGPGVQQPAAACAFPDGSFAVAGAISDVAKLGEGETNETTLPHATSADFFVARYEADGDLSWARAGIGPSFDVATGLAALPGGAIAMSGGYGASITLNPGLPDETTLADTGSHALVVRYDANGAISWTAVGTGSSLRFAKCAGFDDGSIVAVGFRQGAATFGAGGPTETTLPVSSLPEGIVARFNDDGGLEWVRRARNETSTGINLEWMIEVEALPDGGAIVAGNFSGTTTFGPGETNEALLTTGGSDDTFFARYEANGDLRWVRRIGGLSTDLFRSLVRTSAGEVIVAGRFSSPITLAPGEPEERILTPVGGIALFVGHFDESGRLLHTWQAGAPGFGPSVSAALASFPDGTLAALFGYDVAVRLGAGTPFEVPFTTSNPDDFVVAVIDRAGFAALPE